MLMPICQCFIDFLFFEPKKIFFHIKSSSLNDREFRLFGEFGELHSMIYALYRQEFEIKLRLTFSFNKVPENSLDLICCCHQTPTTMCRIMNLIMELKLQSTIDTISQTLDTSSLFYPVIMWIFI